MTLTVEAQLKMSGVLAKMTADALEGAIDVLLIMPGALYDIFNSYSPEWDIPTIFSDAEMASPIMLDLDFSASTSFEPGTGLIPHQIVARNTSVALGGVIVVATLSYFGFRQAGSLMSVLFAKLFGVKAKINKLDDKIENLTDMVQSMILTPNKMAAQTGADDVNSLRVVIDNIVSMLANADIEMTGLIDALVTNKTSMLKPTDWSKDNTPLLE
jgi:hypothetical protein